jgi:RES domain-containing protein
VIRCWRITKHKHFATAFSGGGARKYGGRWNSPGTAIVYTAGTQSLAALEMLVHLDSAGLLQDYILIGVEIEESSIQNLDRAKLPDDWRTDPPPPALRKIGDEWVAGVTSVALRVPSALVPDESNVLVNPAHSDFAKLVIGKPISFSFDTRLKV